MPEVWRLVKPLLVYYVGYYVIHMIVGTLLAGSGMAYLMGDGGSIVNGIAMVGGCAVLYPMIEEEREQQRKEKREKGDAGIKSGKPVLWYLALIVFAVSSVVFFNTLVGMSGLLEQSDAYQEVAKRQYAVSLGMGLFLYAGVSAVVEEVVFRFLLYNRLYRFGGRLAFGVVASAFLFGVYHGNIVQGIYAFMIGVLMALAYACFDNFLAPVLFHGLGNAVIFLSNMIPEAQKIVFSPVMFWVFGLITAAGSVFLVRQAKTNP